MGVCHRTFSSFLKIEGDVRVSALSTFVPSGPKSVQTAVPRYGYRWNADRHEERGDSESEGGRAGLGPTLTFNSVYSGIQAKEKHDAGNPHK